MHYPKEFVAKVKAIFPNSEALIGDLDSGNVGVGKFLDNERLKSIPAQTIIDALETGNTTALLSEARGIVSAAALYSEWSELYKQQNPGSAGTDIRDENSKSRSTQL